jgi:integrase
MRLTAQTVRTIVLPPGVTDKVFFDRDLPGFGVRVRATGAKTWMIQYAIAGRTRRMTLGSTSVLDPGKARETAKDLLAKVRLGGDPVGDKVGARIRAGETVGALIPGFLERQRARLKPRSWQEVNRHLTAHAKPLHSYPITTIERRAIANRLAEIEKASGPAACNRVRTSLSAFFSWAAREGYIDANPAAFTNKAIENGSRERVLVDDELATIWHEAGEDQYGAIVKLLMLTGARRDEIASLRWSEVDLDAATITLPPARTKNRREHVIPLSNQALAILEAQPRRVEADNSERDHVFGYGRDRGYQDWSAQPRRVEADGIERDHVFGYGRGRGWQDWSGSKADLDARITSARNGRGLDWRLHDFRRSLSTALHERFNVPPHVVEAILGHVGGHKAGVAGVYNKALYLDERRRALGRWAAYIDAILSSKPKEIKVVKFNSGPARHRQAEPALTRASSAMPEADEKATARTPMVHSGEVKIWGKGYLSASGDKGFIKMDGPELSPLEWLKEAVVRLKAAPDCPKRKTEAARRLAREMAEANRRRGVLKPWGAGHITNVMRDLELWERRRPKK